MMSLHRDQSLWRPDLDAILITWEGFKSVCKRRKEIGTAEIGGRSVEVGGLSRPAVAGIKRREPRVFRFFCSTAELFYQQVTI
jgi:hypothetical protein